MDFRELTYVLAIAKHRNITKASESLYISQPTLSKFLKGLESDLGLPLFRRLGNRYLLTYAGERYVEKAEKILQLKEDLDREMGDILKRDVGVLKVGFPTMRSIYMLPNTLPAFQMLYPNMRVEIREGHSSDLDGHILSGEVELAFYTQSSEVQNPLLEYEVLGEEELLICTVKDHPIGKYAQPNPGSKYPRLDPALLKDERVILMRPTQRTRQILDKHLQSNGVQYENIVTTSSMQALMELAAIGYGVSFIFEPHIRHRWPEGAPIDCYSFGAPASNFVVAYRKGSYLPTYARDFIGLVRQTYRRD